MTTTKKAKYSSFVSPVGIAKFAWLDKPDTGYDGKSEPKYKVRIVLDDTTETRDWVAGVIAQGQKDAKLNSVKLKKVFKTPFQMPEDQDEDDYLPAEGKDKPKLDEDHVGRIFFDMKTAYAPGLIDSERNTLAEGVKIFGGDTIKVKFELYAYDGLGSGLSFRVKTVQLVQKNGDFSGRGPDTDGFDDIEGYVGNDSAADDDDEHF